MELSHLLQLDVGTLLKPPGNQGIRDPILHEHGSDPRLHIDLLCKHNSDLGTLLVLKLVVRGQEWGPLSPLQIRGMGGVATR